MRLDNLDRLDHQNPRLSRTRSCDLIGRVDESFTINIAPMRQEKLPSHVRYGMVWMWCLSTSLSGNVTSYGTSMEKSAAHAMPRKVRQKRTTILMMAKCQDNGLRAFSRSTMSAETQKIPQVGKQHLYDPESLFKLAFLSRLAPLSVTHLKIWSHAHWSNQILTCRYGHIRQAWLVYYLAEGRLCS